MVLSPITSKFKFILNSYSFNKTILPRNNKNLKELVTLRDSYFIDVNMLLPYEVESALAKIFSTILNSIP